MGDCLIDITANANRTKAGAKGLRWRAAPAFVLIAALFAFTPISVAADEPGEGDCYQINDECVPFDDITENSTVYLAGASDGSTKGFDDFSQYQSYIKSEFDLDISLEGGKLVVDPGGDGPARRVGLQRSSGFGIFYDRDDSRGSAFIVHSPDFIPDLSRVRLPNGRRWNTWDNKISSVSTRAGGVALVCLKKQCNGGPAYFFTVPAGTSSQLLGGLNNSASAVGVF